MEPRKGIITLAFLAMMIFLFSPRARNHEIFMKGRVTQGVMRAYYRADGVRIQHDPTDERLLRKYGSGQNADPDGFDPQADSVGAGIYGGKVVRDEDGEVVIGTLRSISCDINITARRGVYTCSLGR